MKKSITILLFITLVLKTFGQLNPINDITWDQWYITPNNYFDLNWESPDPSVDTLLGYNIYRNNDLYRFQTETRLFHTQNEENCSEDFLFYENPGSFWIHITAVYNSSYDESVYYDSVYSKEPAVSIEEFDLSNKKVFPNPTNGKVNIKYKNVKSILLFNLKGDLIKEYKSQYKINISTLPKGIYMVRVITENGCFANKIVLEPQINY